MASKQRWLKRNGGLPDYLYDSLIGEHVIMRINSPLLLGISLLTFSFLAVASAAAQTRYAITEIAPLAGHHATGAWDINNLSQVLAASSKTNDLDLGNGIPIIWKSGVSKKLPGLPNGSVTAYRINNNKIAVGDYWPPQGSVNAIYWRSYETPVRLPFQAEMDQFYPIGLSDLGLITGFAAFYPNTYKGFLYDTNTGRLDFNETYVYGDSNGLGDMIRALAENDRNLEVTTSRGVYPLPIPEGLRSFYGTLDPHMGPSGTVTSFLTDDDGADGCSGCGGSCVRWDPPSYHPAVFNPPGFGSRDYCSPGRANKSGDVLVNHSREVGEDDYKNVPMVVLGSRYFEMTSFCPELARFEYFYLNAINDRREIVGTGYRDGTVRGFILRPLQ